MVALGWLAGTHVQSVWAYLAHGETTTGDPYIDLRAWLAKEPAAKFALAGEAAAFHLGYLHRHFDGPVSVWSLTATALHRAFDRSCRSCASASPRVST